MELTDWDKWQKAKEQAWADYEKTLERDDEEASIVRQAARQRANEARIRAIQEADRLYKGS